VFYTASNDGWQVLSIANRFFLETTLAIRWPVLGTPSNRFEEKSVQPVEILTHTMEMDVC